MSDTTGDALKAMEEYAFQACEGYREVLEKILKIQEDDFNVMNMRPNDMLVMINEIVKSSLLSTEKETNKIK